MSPRIPDYNGASLPNVVPALRARLGGDDTSFPWMPKTLSGVANVVLLVLDGLGALQLQSHGAQVPTLAGASVGSLDSVCPTTTVAALTSITTSTPPGQHGLLGYRMVLDGEIFYPLSWQRNGIDVRESYPPAQLLGAPSFPGFDAVPAIGRSDYGATGFSGAHLGNTKMIAAATPSSIAVCVADALSHGNSFVYAYYDGIDRVAHANGLGRHYDAELRASDQLVGDIVSRLPKETALVVIADHGQVEVGASVLHPPREVFDSVTLLSGEGRFRWFHAKEGAAADLYDALKESFGSCAWVMRKDELFTAGFFGPNPRDEFFERLGDVVVAPFEPVAILDPGDVGESRIVARHGSLTRTEVEVPLCVFLSTRA